MRWLTAHRIAEMVLLAAQHLHGDTAEQVDSHVRRRLRITLVFVYGGPARPSRPATTTLADFLARPRRSPPAFPQARPWPRVPRSHPLRLRYDCFKQLAPDEFERVDRLLVGSLKTLGAWRWSRPYLTRRQLTRALRVVSAAADPEQAYIRRCGAELVLLCDGIPVARTRQLRLRGRSLTSAQIDQVHAYTAPWVAGYLLAELVTGLPAELLQLIVGDQISANAILGCPVPAAAGAVLRALEDRHEPVLESPEGPMFEPLPARPAFWRPTDQAFAAAVAELLRGRSARVPVGDMTPRVRARFEQLRAERIMELERGGYQATYIALYSSYRLPTPPIRALTGEWQPSIPLPNNPDESLPSIWISTVERRSIDTRARARARAPVERRSNDSG